MPFDWIALSKTAVMWVIGRALKAAGKKYTRRKASEKAMRGEDLAYQGSLHSLVKIELEGLAANDKVIPGLHPHASRNWLRQDGNVDYFIEALIAQTSNNPELSLRAEDELAADYERLTHHTKDLSKDAVRKVTSYVYGQLQATDRGRQALQSSLDYWSAAQLHKLRHPEQHQNPSDADLDRVRSMAATLLEVGKHNWKMPRFVAPLTLEVHVQQDGQEPRPTSASELSTVIETGSSLVLFGTGGIGKTTFLLDLCTSCLDSGHRIPLFVDAAAWARTNVSLFGYITSRPAAIGNRVTSAELTKLAEAGRLVIMLNGWNEMASSSKPVCREELIQQTAATEALNVVVVSRSVNDAPSLSNAKQIEVRGLTWQGQSAVVRAELGDDRVAPLLELLARNTRLRHAARSPLILRGLIAQSSKGVVTNSRVFDLLGAAVQTYEEDDQRHLVLSIAPVEGHQCAYLEELSCLLTQRLATNCSRDEALQAFHSAAARLTELRLISVTPHLTSVLDVLVSHHLLHLDDGVVRFAHQRFQEYFAATRLLRECIEDVISPDFLRTAINLPSWSDSLILVADKLKGEREMAAARVRLVKTTAAIDIGLACDLAGTCALSEADDLELHHHLVARVNELVTSPLVEVRDLGVSYQLASGLSVFAEMLWPLLESEDQQTRLHTYRLNGTAISLAQLGAGAKLRIASWPSDRRVEFVHEISNNADNYELIVNLARSEPDPAVRTAAISALFWNFPASDVPLQAWLDAPVEVQTEHNIVSSIQYALEDGRAGDSVRERLRTIAVNHLSGNAQLQLALAFPDEVGPRVLDVVFERLRNSERHGNDAPLVTIAQVNASARLLDLARELALQVRAVPDWVGEYLHEVPADVRTDIFERAWTILQGQAFGNLRSKILGPLADRNQIERSVDSWLQYSEAERMTQTDIDHERHRQLGYLLAHAPENDLMNVVMQRGQAATYNVAAQLIDLVLLRIGRDDGGARTDNLWLPTLDEVRQLVAQFTEKAETAEVPQDTVRMRLCLLASSVAPAEFGPLLLETCRRHLDAWSIFQEKVDQWSKRATSDRPRNPEGGTYLATALTRWGPDALPGLLELMAHPSAMKFIPEAVARIVSLPWASKRERLFNSVSTDIQEGEQRRRLRRELRQPDDIFQHWTDEAVRVLGQKLNDMVVAYQEKKATDMKWNAREAEYRVGYLAGAVASIPSAGVVEPAHRALASGLMDVYGTVRTLRGLVRQGLYVSDMTVIRQLEALYEQTANAKWHDHSSRYAMSELSELLLCVVPTSLLSKPMDHYLQQWRRFSNPNEMIHHLGAVRSETSWLVLLVLGKELTEKGQPTEEVIRALVSALTPQHLNEFIALVADRTLFAWCRSDWTLEQLAPSVAVVLGEATDRVSAFVEACRRAQLPLADALGGEVLSNIKGGEEVLQSFLLEALDAGRAVHSNMPAYRKLRGMFSLKVPINDNQYEITPKASNELRAQLYARAKGAGPIADGCRRLLASLECGRREDGRPDDELRHPNTEDGMVWTDALLGPQVTH
jgi:hypothetical protein